MLSAAYYFRGNYMTPEAAGLLLRKLCSDPATAPKFWNIYEPINIPLDLSQLHDIVRVLSPNPEVSIRSVVFLIRKSKPRYLMTIDVRLWECQGTTAHNRIFVDKWSASSDLLADHVCQNAANVSADFASVPNGDDDNDRYAEFYRSYTPSEFLEFISIKQPTIAPFGPFGCLGDVQWFNYFGRVYIDAIGRSRLMNAGWARVEEIGEGLACYATEKIDDPQSRERRDRIIREIEEFVWTPGCRQEDKVVPEFDFSEQYAAIPPNVMRKLMEAKGPPKVHFAGMTEEEQASAIQALEKEGGLYDSKTHEFKQSTRNRQ